jgi:hypothetical protein
MTNRQLNYEYIESKLLIEMNIILCTNHLTIKKACNNNDYNDYNDHNDYNNKMKKVMIDVLDIMIHGKSEHDAINIFLKTNKNVIMNHKLKINVDGLFRINLLDNLFECLMNGISLHRDRNMNELFINFMKIDDRIHNHIELIGKMMDNMSWEDEISSLLSLMKVDNFLMQLNLRDSGTNHDEHHKYIKNKTKNILLNMHTKKIENNLKKQFNMTSKKAFDVKICDFLVDLDHNCKKYLSKTMHEPIAEVRHMMIIKFLDYYNNTNIYLTFDNCKQHDDNCVKELYNELIKDIKKNQSNIYAHVNGKMLSFINKCDMIILVMKITSCFEWIKYLDYDTFMKVHTSIIKKYIQNNIMNNDDIMIIKNLVGAMFRKEKREWIDVYFHNHNKTHSYDEYMNNLLNSFTDAQKSSKKIEHNYLKNKTKRELCDHLIHITTWENADVAYIKVISNSLKRKKITMY